MLECIGVSMASSGENGGVFDGFQLCECDIRSPLGDASNIMTLGWGSYLSRA